jgi:RNA polymerase sigma-70 factor (ECF subfamily)
MLKRLPLPWLHAGETEEAPSQTTPADEVSDETELITAARAGDEEAFAALVSVHQSEILRLARRMVRDEEEAADITQDVFVAAWRGLQAFRGDAQVATWLYRIAYHRCLKALEARRKQAADLAQLAAAHVERIAEAWNAMQTTLAEQQWRLAIQEQISHLPEKYRTVLRLRHMQGMSYAEIAEDQTISVGSVKTHLFRARAMLAQRLQQLECDAQSAGTALGQRWQNLAANVEELRARALLRGHVVLQGR